MAHTRRARAAPRLLGWIVLLAGVALAPDAGAHTCVLGHCPANERGIGICCTTPGCLDCVACGGNNQLDCMSSADHPLAACQQWKNWSGGGCQNCGASGQTTCHPTACPSTGAPSSTCSFPGGSDDVCQDFLVPTTGGTCQSCGQPGLVRTFSHPSFGTITTNVCFDGAGDPNPSWCRPQYNEIGDVFDPVIGIACQECGRDDDYACLHTTPCDPGRVEFSLDPVRQKVIDAFTAQTSHPDALAAANALDYCWNPQAIDFSLGPQANWPADEAEPGPRTWIQIHGRNGGELSLGASAEGLGTRNWLRYRVDYNAKGQVAQPWRIWGWDERGQPYIAYEEQFDGADIVFPDNYAWTLRDVADFVARGLARIPVHGDLILQGHSMGGYVIKDVMRRHYDELRFRGRRIANMIFTSHPHFGIVLDPALYTPYLCTSLALDYTADPGDPDEARQISQDCKSGRYMIAWNQSQASIDNAEYPFIKWAAGSGDCDLGNPSSGCLCQPSDPPQCVNPTIEVPPPGQMLDGGGGASTGFLPAGFTGFENVQGDTLVPIASCLGIDEYDHFFLDDLEFDRVDPANPGSPELAATGDCNHVSECGVDALLLLDPGLYGDVPVCGDLSGEQVIDSLDLDLLRGSLADAFALTAPEAARCSVAPGDEGCDLLDFVYLARALEAQGPPLVQSCSDGIDLGRGLALYWPFEAGLGALNAAESGPFFDGVLTGGPQQAEGILGDALQFLGSGQDVRVSNPQALQALSAHRELTLSAWIHPIGQAGVSDIVFNKEGEYELARFNDGSIRWALAPDWSWIDSGLSATTGQWSHVALVVDVHAGLVTTFVNGMASALPWSSGEIGDALPAQNELRVAGRQSNSDAFIGRIDEAAIWMRALSPHEIALLYSGGAGRSLGSVSGTPEGLSPTIWLDASDGASVTRDAGQQVFSWADRSGNGYGVSLPAGATSPDWIAGSRNGLATVRFNGASDVLCGTTPLALPDAVTIVAVARNDVRKNYNGIFSTRASTSVNAALELYWQIGATGSGNLVYLVNRGLPGAGSIAGNGFGPAAGNYYVAKIRIDSAAGAGRLEVDAAGVAGAALLPSASNPICVGLGFGTSISPNALDGDIAELLVFDRALAPDELQSLEIHLRRKWGL